LATTRSTSKKAIVTGSGASSLFHGMRSRDDLKGGEAKIERFPTHLAVEKNVSPATQNQAMNALVFLYKKVLKQPLEGKIDAVRARKKQNIPVVMTREEVAGVISLIKGTPQLVVKLLYGSGLGIAETIRLGPPRPCATLFHPRAPPPPSDGTAKDQESLPASHMIRRLVKCSDWKMPR